MRAYLEQTLLRLWQRRSWFAYLNWPWSRLFGYLLERRRQAFQTGARQVSRLPVPVIVVGNIYLGGTGKTPLVIYLVQQLRAAGWRPGVISRGYGSAAATPQLLTPNSLAQECGDEPVLIQQRTGVAVAVGRERGAAARLLLAQDPEINIIISDDGLQHYALARDIECLVFDGRGLGNGWLLPAGPLREPATRQRDFTIVNSQNGQIPDSLRQASNCHVMSLQLGAAYALANPTQRRELTDFATQKNMLAMAGIGHPERFFNSLRAVGLQFSQQALADHYQFNPESLRKFAADVILITEKDAVKCRAIPALRDDLRIWVVPVEAHLPAQFCAELLAKLSEKKHGCALT